MKYRQIWNMQEKNDFFWIRDDKMLKNRIFSSNILKEKINYLKNKSNALENLLNHPNPYILASCILVQLFLTDRHAYTGFFSPLVHGLKNEFDITIWIKNKHNEMLRHMST